MPPDAPADFAPSIRLRPAPFHLLALAGISYVTAPLLALGVAMMAHDDVLSSWRDGSENLVFLAPPALFLAMLLALAPRGRAARWQRAFVVVVFAHLLLLPASLVAIEPRIDITFDRRPLLAAALAGGAIGIASVLLAARGRSGAPRALRAWAGFALTLCLGVGLGMPVLAALVHGGDPLPNGRLLLGAVPPSLAVAAFLGFGEKPLSRRAVGAIWAAAAPFAIAASVIIPPLKSDGFLALLADLPLLIGCEAIAVATLAAIAFLQWWAVRGLGATPRGAPPELLTGTVECEAEVAGWFTYLGVLRGMRAEIGPFMLYNAVAAATFLPLVVATTAGFLRG